MNVRYHTFGFELTDALRRHVEWRLWQSLRHVAPRVVSATVRLDDINGTHGGIDKRCSVVIALAQRGTIVARAVHADMYSAIDHAAHRIRIAAQRAVTRRDARERRAPNPSSEWHPVLRARRARAETMLH